VFAPGKLDKPGFEIDVRRRLLANANHTDSGAARGALGQLLARLMCRAVPIGKEMCDLPQLRERRAGSCRAAALGGRGADPRPPCRVQLFARFEASGGNWSIPDLFGFVANPKTMRSGHGDDLQPALRGRPSGPTDGLPQQLVRQSHPLNKPRDPATRVRHKRRMTLQRANSRVVDQGCNA